MNQIIIAWEKMKKEYIERYKEVYTLYAQAIAVEGKICHVEYLRGRLVEMAYILRSVYGVDDTQVMLDRTFENLT